MADVSDGGARDDDERNGPKIVRQVFHPDDSPVDTRQKVFHEVGEQHRHDEHERDLVENVEKGRPERDFVVFFDERKANRNENRRDEVRHERVGGHFFEFSAEFLRNHGRGGGTGRHDAHEYGLQKHERRARRSIGEYERHGRHDERDLCRPSPEMPFHGAHPMEIDLAEGDEKDAEHEQRQNFVAHRPCPRTERVERRRVGEKQIAERAHHHRGRQRPVFEQSGEVHLWIITAESFEYYIETKSYFYAENNQKK